MIVQIADVLYFVGEVLYFILHTATLIRGSTYKQDSLPAISVVSQPLPSDVSLVGTEKQPLLAPTNSDN